jgi:hypothetical protein
MLRVGRMLALGVLALLPACARRGVPEESTSLVRDPGPNPGHAHRNLSMVWLHHSTGDALLKGGLRAALDADGILFHDINYEQARVDDYVIGDHTDTADWPRTFNTPKYFDVVKTWELRANAQHDIIMFKSCFPNSAITSEDMLSDYKQQYSSLLPTFRAHRDIVFIAMSTPPLVKAATNPDDAKRARRWARWVTTEYATDVKNVKVFDLFDALAIPEGKPDENTLVPQFAKAADDSHPADDGARAVTRLFIPWLNRAIRETGLAQ